MLCYIINWIYMQFDWFLPSYNLSKDRHIDEITTTCIFHHTKQINPMLLWACTVTDHTSDTLCYPLMCAFFFFVLTTFWHHLWSITQQRQLRIYLLNKPVQALAFPPAIVDWNMYPMIKQPQTDLINIIHQILWTLCVGLLLHEISQMMAVPISIAVGG